MFIPPVYILSHCYIFGTECHICYKMPDMDKVDYQGQTTLITGASAGLGTEFARQLAARGSHLILVARRADRMEALAAELIRAHGVQVWVIPLDLSQMNAGERLFSEVTRKGLEVTSLINNAGFGTHGPFHTEDPQRLQDELSVNIHSLVSISRQFIAPLRNAGKGVLINVASVAAYMPFPNMAVYAASKAFVLNFTEALWQESRGTGLRVIALSPGATQTEFFEVLGNENADGGRGRERPQDVVRTVLHALDQASPPPSVISNRMNRLLTAAARLFSRRRLVLMAGSMTQQSSTHT